MRFRWPNRLLLIFGLLWGPVNVFAEGQAAGPSPALETVVHRAFLATHDGYSVDETLIDEDRFAAFQAQCLALAAEAQLKVPNTVRHAQRAFADALLHLRKTGRIGSVTSQRAPKPGPDAPDQTAYRFAVEIAARQIQAEHGAHTDDILVDPELRRAFCEAARSVCGDLPGLTNTMLIRDALRLRKSRQLRPELVARIADWGKTVRVYSLTEFKAADTPPALPGGPGVYLFRDATGYLYIGEAKNLRTRLKQHLDDSDRTQLAEYLDEHGDAETIQIEVHAFDAESDARLVAYRRAYESDLIASRQPRFNVRP